MLRAAFEISKPCVNKKCFNKRCCASRVAPSKTNKVEPCHNEVRSTIHVTGICCASEMSHSILGSRESHFPRFPSAKCNNFGPSSMRCSVYGEDTNLLIPSKYNFFIYNTSILEAFKSFIAIGVSKFMSNTRLINEIVIFIRALQRKLN